MYVFLLFSEVLVLLKQKKALTEFNNSIRASNVLVFYR